MRALSSHRGFTLIELLFVLIVIVILSVIAFPKWTGHSINLNDEAIRVLSDIRYTQIMSVNTGQRYRWVRASATTYQILNQAGTATMFPNGSTTQTLTSGVSFGTLTNLPNNLIAFDTQGAPYTTSTVPGTALASTATIPLTATGATTRTIQITAVTGYGVLA